MGLAHQEFEIIAMSKSPIYLKRARRFCKTIISFCLVAHTVRNYRKFPSDTK